jgi:hypothetical protein
VTNYHAKARLESTIKTILDRMDRLGIGRQTKSINEITRDYRDLLERLVVDVVNGNLTAGGMARQMRDAIIEDATLVYHEGMREGGDKTPEEDMDSTDDQAIADWVLSQTPYVYGFADDCRAASKLDGDDRTDARNGLLDRVDTWVQALENLGRIAYANTKANEPGTWQLGRTEKHCETCAELNGQRHRLKWFLDKGYIPQQPGSETLACGGWNCDCQIVDDDGERLL